MRLISVKLEFLGIKYHYSLDNLFFGFFHFAIFLFIKFLKNLFSQFFNKCNIFQLQNIFNLNIKTKV